MTYKFTNNASTTLVIPAAIDTVTLIVAAGGGDLFPSLGAGEVFQATLVGSDGHFEIIKATARAGDTLTVVRGQEGTPAQTFDIGSLLELRDTAAVLDSMLQKTGGVMSGDIDLNGNTISNMMLEGEVGSDNLHLQVTSIRATDRAFDQVDPSGIMDFPTGKRRPRINQSAILVARMLQYVVWPWYGDMTAIPSYFKICNGTNGTPDLRGRFLVGQNPEFPYGTTGGRTSSTTEADGARPAGVTGNTSLTAAQVPEIVITENSRQDAAGATKSVTTVGYGAAGAPHAHTVPAEAAHTHEFTIRPPYFSLIYVMFHLPGFDEPTPN